MNPRPLHAPYAGRHRPFSIAMAPLTGDWLEVDARREEEVAQKRAIFARGEGFRAEPGTEAAQSEAEARIVAELRERGLLPGPPPPAGAPPLMRAALMVQDDLVLMRRDEAGWRLAAAAVAFPSMWSLEEKFALPMDAIHKSVPGWAGPMGTRVARIFDALRPDATVWRLNWSLQWGGGLAEPRTKASAPRRQGEAAATLVRVERQTLTRLPASGDLLFTIKVMLDPLAALLAHPDAARLCEGLATQLERLDADELAYKGITDRDALVTHLRFASGAAPARSSVGQIE